MTLNKFVVCYDAVAKDYFEVSEVHLVDHKYRANYYQINLRLTFHKNDVDIHRRDEMKTICFDKIINQMTVDNLWPRHNGFCVVTYRVRLLNETIGEFLNKQAAMELWNSYSSGSESDGDLTDDDSAYGSSSSESSDDVSLSDESSNYGSDGTVIDLRSLPPSGDN